MPGRFPPSLGPGAKGGGAGGEKQGGGEGATKGEQPPWRPEEAEGAQGKLRSFPRR